MPPKKLTRQTAAAVLQVKNAAPALETDRMFGLTGTLPRLIEVDVANIRTNPDQPRTVFDEAALASLAESIERHGLQQPVLVQETAEKGVYRLVAGERRLRAHQMLGRPTIAAIITKGKAEEIALIENVQRVDLDAIDLARGLSQLIDAHGYAQAEVAAAIGVSEAEVSKRLKVLDLPGDILTEYRENPDAVSRSALVELAFVGDEAEVRRLWKSARTGGLTVQSVRAARASKDPASPEPLRVLGKAINRIDKDLTAISSVSSALQKEHRDLLRDLRSRIDALLGE
ncbi:ParB/RepB/Spo0J family partition protein [Azospirillum rugosum]|uniref:ParB family chromosome partitioning protein n=1 Tax=Azospirillum rugosum TaxID=416170 RepID=A0ABS4STZ6_9PROT|nr:ParB/RepB/Spo0J family partition protein [Azospirillum rugosum]MBP2296040.1 ParB family chromosome partitioning protein [Azospirillum rugosum]MDQ0529630.1 ParB family chromosome partitioning protein [Azospirillum rugosum]